jgi:glycosyltransferase involved in cell wall biosynthesis
MSKILISSRCAWDLINYRSGQIQAIRNCGQEVICAAAADGYEKLLDGMGARFIALPVPVRSINPVADLRLMWRFYQLYRREQPDVVHHFTTKPIIYGGIAARFAKVPCVVNTITGLGYSFSDCAPRMLRRVVELQYRAALSTAHTTFFQNEDDRTLFTDGGLVHRDRTRLLPGSGVNTQHFSPRQPTSDKRGDQPVVFLMMGRLLKDKGVYEFVEAARRVRLAYPGTRFQLLGRRDETNPSVVPLADLQTWQDSGEVEYLGVTDDVRDSVSGADVIVLPSYYREGTPRSLLEGAAMGKPIITTDAVGCREVVDQGVNGLLVRVKDAAALAEAMICMLEDEECRHKMGLAGREKIVREFDEQIVIQRCLAAYRTDQSHVPDRVTEPARET